jgi:hypothetical protein
VFGRDEVAVSDAVEAEGALVGSPCHALRLALALTLRVGERLVFFGCKPTKPFCPCPQPFRVVCVRGIVAARLQFVGVCTH